MCNLILIYGVWLFAPFFVGDTWRIYASVILFGAWLGFHLVSSAFALSRSQTITARLRFVTYLGVTAVLLSRLAQLSGTGNEWYSAYYFAGFGFLVGFLIGGSRPADYSWHSWLPVRAYRVWKGLAEYPSGLVTTSIRGPQRGGSATQGAKDEHAPWE